MILIIAERFDPHTDFVTEELDNRKLRWKRIHLSDFPQEVSISYIIRNSGIEGKIVFQSEQILLSDILSIWYRRTESFSFPNNLLNKELIIAKRECHQFINGLWAVLPNVNWVSSPMSLRLAEQKPLQLINAKKIGFNVKATCFSNDPIEIKTFFSQCQKRDRLVYKPFTPILIKNNNKVGVVYTKLLDSYDFEKLNQVQFFPGIFQVYIDKIYDIRVTVFGVKVFACKIDSQSIIDTAVDMRAYSWEKNNMPQHTPYNLPSSLEKKCIDIVKLYGLKFGAIDLVRDKKGEYYFLEINPNGQWAWVEHLTGLPMRNALIDLLASA